MTSLKIRLSILSVMLWVILWIFPALGDSRFRLPEPPIPIREMQVAAYSKEFAMRFNLPNPEPAMELTGPIYAMRFFITYLYLSPYLNTPAYGCAMQVYFDKKLSIAFPTDAKTWSRRIYMPDRQGWLDRKPGPLRLPDQIQLAENESVSSRLVAIATPNYEWGGEGAWGTHFVEGFDREIVSNIAYMEIGVLCPSPAVASNSRGLQLWLKKQGSPDFRTERMDYDAFMKFPIPELMLSRITPWLDWYTDYRRKQGEEESRVRREQRRTGNK